MLTKLILSPEEQSALQQLGSMASTRTSGSPEGRLANWTASGPGPVALIGGAWVNGVALCPKFQITHPSRVVSLTWNWDTGRLGEWSDFALLRLMILDVETKSCWTLDVASLPSSTFIVPGSAQLSANCAVALQLKAGDRVGKLYSPPFVRSIDVAVRYRV